MKTKYVILFAVLVLMVSGCHKATYLSADENTVTMPRSGGTDSLILHSDGSHFTLISSPEWADVELQDSVLRISAKANPGTSIRKGVIAVGNDDQRLSLTLIQAAPASYMTLKENVVTIPQDGSAVTLEVETDGSSVVLEGPEGVTASYKAGVLTIKGSGNSGKTRKSKAVVVCDSVRRQITVVEKGTCCARCNGKKVVTCPYCAGQGEVYCPWYICSSCHGSGRITCPECKGKGK